MGEFEHKPFDGIGAVSYTHLDVYKRQVQNRIRTKGFIQPRPVALLLLCFCQEYAGLYRVWALINNGLVHRFYPPVAVSRLSPAPNFPLPFA